MLDSATAGRIAEMLLQAIRREFPNKPGAVLGCAEDARPPRELTPIFYGCFDWHSAVHSHWTLLRLISTHPQAAWAQAVRDMLDDSFRVEHVRGEVAFLERETSRGFELPYGIAWLLELCAELHRADAETTPKQRWALALAPLESLAAVRFSRWLAALPGPIRSGQHPQSAFAMGLARDWATARADTGLAALVDDRARAFYGADHSGPITYEPSAHDFLSPCLSEADLMRRVMGADEFSRWLHAFLPRFESLPLRPVEPANRADGKLAHFDGLNASRAWMLLSIARALPPDDARSTAARALARDHGRAAMRALDHDEYAVTHWVGSFIVYYLTQTAPASSSAT